MDLISRVPRLPRLGETIVCYSFQMSYGGKGANQAVMAAKLRAQVTLVTKLGRDGFGEGLFANYRQQGVDTTHVFFDDERGSGVAPIFVDDNSQNFIVIPGPTWGSRQPTYAGVRPPSGLPTSLSASSRSRWRQP